MFNGFQKKSSAFFSVDFFAVSVSARHCSRAISLRKLRILACDEVNMIRWLYGVFIVLLAAWIVPAEEIDLAGQWSFALDANDAGIKEQWFAAPLPHTLSLPGSLQGQGFGDIPTRHTEWMSGIGMDLLDDPRFATYVNDPGFKCPFWLTPDRVYAGVAWYRRDVVIPASWEGKSILLVLERPHWQTTVWVNETKIGSQDSLGVAHQYDVTGALQPGTPSSLTIRVDNRYVVPVGKDAHSISDQTQSNWNGIVGKIVLRSQPRIRIDNLQVYPQIESNHAKLEFQLTNRTGASGEGMMRVFAKSYNSQRVHEPEEARIPIQWGKDDKTIVCVYSMGEALYWDEYDPALYHLTIVIEGENWKTEKTVSFGMRTLSVTEKQFAINGRVLFLRGTLECCIFPLHGYPPTDVNEWKRLIRIAKSYGLNHFRFHSWCPPAAAFTAADEEGFYLQAEASCWAVFGDQTKVDTWIYEECERMIQAYGNHPSFILMSPSNEPHGKNRDAFLGQLITHLKRVDSRRFYTAGAGWPQIPENQFDIQYATRLQNWPSLKFDQPPQTWDDYGTYVDTLSVPTVSHEIGQWCVYPDLREDAQYTGVLKAKNIAIFRDKLEQSGMGERGHDFLMASGAFQTLLYKQEIEAALRTPHFAGFQLLDLHDFPGQGTAPVGVLNALWQDKGYVTGAEYRRFCNDIVPLVRLKKRVFTHDETLELAIDVANYSNKDLIDQNVVCWLRWDSGRVFSQSFSVSIPAGGITRVGSVSQPLGFVQKAGKVRIEVVLTNTPYQNDWETWVYPTELKQSNPAVLIVSDWDEAIQSLQTGRDVLFLPDAQYLACDTRGTFQPIFWNRITFPSQTVHTVGILCDNTHPALNDFPCETHSNWQWQELLDRSKPIVMDELPPNLHPIIQPIDDWNDCRKLGLLFEAQLGKGRLLVCSIDLLHDLESRPVARQLRHSLLQYMESDCFDPSIPLAEQDFLNLRREPTLLQKLGATIQADSEQKGYEAHRVIDGDPQTIWHTQWEPSRDALPHSLLVDLKKAIPIHGLEILPRQDMSNGRIARFAIDLSLDGQHWQESLWTGTWNNDHALKVLKQQKPVNARFIRVRALSEVNGQPYASLAEMKVLTE
jgi:hypothetical protein